MEYTWNTQEQAKSSDIEQQQIKQYTASNDGGIRNQREHPKMYVAVHPTVVLENYSSS